ncbi:MAG: YceI family protein [Flavobacteriales bacterium]|nr:YceI family protein [Flavobacteriales bacterium]
MNIKHLILSVGTICIISCGDTASGNKSIFPVEHEHSNVDEHNADVKEHESKEATTHVAEEKIELNHKLTFTAFKTPKKVGVNGTFKVISLDNVKASENLEEALQGSTFSVNTNSVDTNNNPERDEKVRTFFFGKLTNTTISGEFIKLENGKATVKIKLNGKEVEKQMTYTSTENAITINGSIDIISDFSAGDALASINEACSALHEGKTWSDVDLKIEISK